MPAARAPDARSRRGLSPLVPAGLAAARPPSRPPCQEPAAGGRLGRPQIHSGTLEALKWIAMFLMVVDHVNKYLYDWAYPAMFNAGRVVMPVFAFVMAYNLARPGLGREGYARIMRRLLAFALLSTPIVLALGKLKWGWYPLNILFMLLAAVVVIDQIERGGVLNRLAAVATFVIGGAFVEYWWPALLLVLACWHYCRTGSIAAGAGVLAALALLMFINGNGWAFAAVPLVALAHVVRVDVPRWRWAFYALYPAHLAVLLGLLLVGAVP